jgi:hypothetical protein
MDIVTGIFDIISTFLAWIWSFLSFLFSIWFIGPILQLAFVGAIAWVIYRYTPRSVRSFVSQRVLPVTSSALTPIRWYLTRLIAKPEWLRQSGIPKPIYIDRPVEVPVRMRRSFYAWLFSQLRTIAFTLTVVVVYVYWETIGPKVMPLLSF